MSLKVFKNKSSPVTLPKMKTILYLRCGEAGCFAAFLVRRRLGTQRSTRGSCGRQLLTHNSNIIQYFNMRGHWTVEDIISSMVRFRPKLVYL